MPSAEPPLVKPVRNWFSVLVPPLAAHAYTHEQGEQAHEANFRIVCLRPQCSASSPNRSIHQTSGTRNFLASSACIMIPGGSI